MLQRVDVQYSYYHHTLLYVDDAAERMKIDNDVKTWRPEPAASLWGQVPKYCKVPNKDEDLKMQQWINIEMQVRCHPYRYVKNFSNYLHL